MIKKSKKKFPLLNPSRAYPWWSSFYLGFSFKFSWDFNRSDCDLFVYGVYFLFYRRHIFWCSFYLLVYHLLYRLVDRSVRFTNFKCKYEVLAYRLPIHVNPSIYTWIICFDDCFMVYFLNLMGLISFKASISYSLL